MRRTISSAALALALGWAGAALGGAADKKLDVYWVDVEGGGATLFVTPAGESILVDTGYPGERDAKRVAKAVLETAGLKKIDHMVITHFHNDHYGALVDILKLVPVGTLYERDVSAAPDSEKNNALIPPYQAAKVDKRVRVKVGDKLALKQAKGAAPLAFQFIGADQKFVAAKGKANAEICKENKPKDPDASDNKNSVVMLVTLGPWRFFDGGDLTWNLENDLVCPKNRVGGPIDVYQTNHHGLDQSNNPVLVKSLAPTVGVMNNGPKKGGEAGAFGTLKATTTIQAIYQVHRNVRTGPEVNTAAELTANKDEACTGNFVKMSVDPQGKTYTVSVPATGHEKTYETGKKK